MEVARDRGHHVDGARKPVVDVRAVLMRQLHEERHEGDVLHVPRRRQAPRLLVPEADAVVGEHDHERLVPDPLRLQPLHHVAERAVGVLGLEQEALVALERRPLLLPDPVPDAAQNRHLDPVRLCRGQVEVGHVRQERVEDVGGRLPAAVEGRGEAADVPCARQDGTVRRAHLGVLGLAEVPPAVADLRDAVHIGRRQHEVQVDDTRVVGQRPARALDLLRGLLALDLLADRGRAHVRDRLDALDVVAAAEQREDVVRVVRVDR